MDSPEPCGSDDTLHAQVHQVLIMPGPSLAVWLPGTLNAITNGSKHLVQAIACT
jgi:hypothetical protein